MSRGIITAADVLARPDQARAAYTGVTGLSTVTFDYFLMLLGTETVKPDTWVLRYLHQVLDRPVSTGEASALLTNAAHRMGRSPREVDHQVWLHMRQTTAASPGGIGVSTRQPAPAALELGSATVAHIHPSGPEPRRMDSWFRLMGRRASVHEWVLPSRREG